MKFYVFIAGLFAVLGSAAKVIFTFIQKDRLKSRVEDAEKALEQIELSDDVREDHEENIDSLSDDDLAARIDKLRRSKGRSK